MIKDLAELHSLVFNSLGEQIAVIDRNGDIVDVNDAWARFGSENGLSGFESRRSNYLQVLEASVAAGDESAKAAALGISGVLAGNLDTFELEYPCHGPDEKRWFMMRVVRLKGTSATFAVSHSNITRRKLAEQRAEYLASHDPLTGLANRRYFNQFLDEELRRCRRENRWASLVAIDLDHFKRYNDEFGHLAGDECLNGVASVLREEARRPGDLPARTGGDEFLLVLGGTDAAGSQLIAETLLSRIREIPRAGPGIPIGASIGVITVPPGTDASDRLLKEVDEALYRAKSAGRDRVALTSLDESAPKAS